MKFWCLKCPYSTFRLSELVEHAKEHGSGSRGRDHNPLNYYHWWGELSA